MVVRLTFVRLLMTLITILLFCHCSTEIILHDLPFHCNVLILGIAGFLGSYVARTLLKNGCTNVIGIDVFSAEYNPLQKRLRIRSLTAYGNTTVHEGNFCDRKYLATVLCDSPLQLSRVILAATVRGPAAKGRAGNAKPSCFANIIETLAKNRECRDGDFIPPTLLYTAQHYDTSLLATPSNNVVQSERRDKLHPPHQTKPALPGLQNGSFAEEHFKSTCTANKDQVNCIGVTFAAHLFGPLDRLHSVASRLVGEIAQLGSETCWDNSFAMTSGESTKQVQILHAADAASAILSLFQYPSHHQSDFIISPSKIESSDEESRTLKDLLYFINQGINATLSPLIDTYKDERGGTFPPPINKSSRCTNIAELVQVLSIPLIELHEINKSDMTTILNLNHSGPFHDEVHEFVTWYVRDRSSLMPCASECRDQGSGSKLCYPSVWGAAKILSHRLTQGCRYVLYTVATGSEVDRLHPIAHFDGGSRSIPEQHHGLLAATRDLDREGWSYGREISRRSRCSIAFVSRSSTLVQSILRSSPSMIVNHDTIYNNRDNSTVTTFGTTSERSFELTSDNAELPVLDYGNWTLVPVGNFSAFNDPRKPSRVPKLSPGQFFASTVQYAVYLDSKLRLTSNPLKYIKMMTMQDGDSGNHGKKVVLMAVRINEQHDLFNHFKHIYQRIKERPSITFYESALRQQEQAYKRYRERFDLQYSNLFDGAFLVHDLKSAAARHFRCMWFSEYQSWSDRDQIAAGFALARCQWDVRRTGDHKATTFIPIGWDTAPEGANSGYGPENPIRHPRRHLQQWENATVKVETSPGHRSSGGRSRGRNLSPSYVRLLPRHPYHWQVSGRIGRLEMFPYNRADDEKYQRLDRFKYTEARNRSAVV